MRKEIVVTCSMLSIAGMAAFGQATGSGAGTGASSAGTSSSQSGTQQGSQGQQNQTYQNLPPGLQNREQLPPGLERRDQLPPGLQRRQGDTTGTDQTFRAGTNAVGGTSQPGSAQTGSSQAGSSQFGGTNQSSSSATVQGQTSTTGSSTTTLTQDRAFTAADQRLLIQVRQQVLPIIGATEASSPVRFVLRNGLVTLVGTVPSAEQKQRIVTLVQQTPGVAQVVDQLQVSASASAGSQSTTTGSQTGVGSSDASVSGGVTSGASYSTNSQWSASNTNRIWGSNTNLSPTGREQGQGQRPNQGSLPPGLEKRDELPPGLQREQLPPGLSRRPNSSGSTQNNNR